MLCLTILHWNKELITLLQGRLPLFWILGFYEKDKIMVQHCLLWLIVLGCEGGGICISFFDRMWINNEFIRHTKILDYF